MQLTRFFRSILFDSDRAMTLLRWAHRNRRVSRWCGGRERTRRRRARSLRLGSSIWNTKNNHYFFKENEVKCVALAFDASMNVGYMSSVNTGSGSFLKKLFSSDETTFTSPHLGSSSLEGTPPLEPSRAA